MRGYGGEERGEGSGQQVSEIKFSKVNVERALDTGEAQFPQEAARLRAENRETDQGCVLRGRPSRFRRVSVSEIHFSLTYIYIYIYTMLLVSQAPNRALFVFGLLSLDTLLR